ncbi:hypothetical protein Ctob_016607, partial [Chrysochromulina tobinii]
MYPNRTSYSDLGGIQALWNLYEQNVFSMATDLIPCTQACGFKPVRMLKFMRAWAQPMMNGSEPAYSWRENGDAPKYFVGDFAGEHCDGEALPGGGCGGSEAYLPKINWDAYKVVELTRWNLLDSCLAQTEFAIGITEDPTMTIQSSNIVTGDVDLDEMLRCIRYSGAQRDADLLRRNVFSGDRVSDWITLPYEICSMPSHIQECVDAAAAHVVETPFYDVSNPPIYCFAWEAHADGDEIAKYLALLPEQYIVPGSSAMTTFDEHVFKASFDEAIDTRAHALIAFGQVDNNTWVHSVRSATSRPIVVLGLMRDVLAHRVQLFYSDDARRQMTERSSSTFVKAMMHSWMQSDE